MSDMIYSGAKNVILVIMFTNLFLFCVHIKTFELVSLLKTLFLQTYA